MSDVNRPNNGQDEGQGNWGDAFQQGITEGLRRATVGDLLDELWRRDPTLVASGHARQERDPYYYGDVYMVDPAEQERARRRGAGPSGG